MDNSQLIASIQASTFRIVTRTSPLAMAQTHEVINSLRAIKELQLTQNNFQILPVEQVLGILFFSNSKVITTYRIPCIKWVEQAFLPNKSKFLCNSLLFINSHFQHTNLQLLFLKQTRKNKLAEIAVHSLKDLPTQIDDDLLVAAVPHLQTSQILILRQKRGDVVIVKLSLRDSYQTLSQLPQGSVIGTSSLRRITNLKRQFPHLIFDNIRGNLNTRLKKLDETDKYTAIILAEAGATRLGMLDRVTQFLDETTFLYAPGQGALGVQCRKDDSVTAHLLSYIDQKDANFRTAQERSFLRHLEGGCKLPIAVYTQIKEDQFIFIGQVWNLDSSKTIRFEKTFGLTEENIGIRMAEIMKKLGATEIVEEVKNALQ